MSGRLIIGFPIHLKGLKVEEWSKLKTIEDVEDYLEDRKFDLATPQPCDEEDEKGDGPSETMYIPSISEDECLKRLEEFVPEKPKPTCLWTFEPPEEIKLPEPSTKEKEIDRLLKEEEALVRAINEFLQRIPEFACWTAQVVHSGKLQNEYYITYRWAHVGKENSPTLTMSQVSKILKFIDLDDFKVLAELFQQHYGEPLLLGAVSMF